MIYYIYKLVCNDVSVTEVYVGSTSNIRNRKYQHKSYSNNPNHKHYTSKICQTIRENGGFENWRMIVLEEMEEGTTLLQSRMREEYWRLELQANLNMRSCGTGLTKEEYNKDYHKEYKNTEKYKEYQKEYSHNEKCKETRKEYEKTEKCKEYRKEYRKKKRLEKLEKDLAKKET